MKNVLNKWQIVFAPRSDMPRFGLLGWRLFRFGIFKMIKLPEEGEILHKKLYKGFIWEFMYWLPIDF